ncbi:dual specificity phosphatase 19, partial [Xenotaenia resolanae]
KGVVLVHCNAGVSRAPAVVIGYLMSCDGQSYEDALSLVKSARPASSPNPGFLEQLRNYKLPTMNGSKD